MVYEAIDSRDGASCAELVSFKHPHVANPRLQMASPEEKCQQVLEPPYDEMFAAHLRCTYAVGNHDFIEAYKCQTVIVQSFLRAFQAHKEENWALPVMYAVALDLRVFANNADQQLVKKGKSKVGDMLEKAAELLMSCFRVCASDTRAGIEDSKKWGMLFLVNQLFKIYFKVGLWGPFLPPVSPDAISGPASTASPGRDPHLAASSQGLSTCGVQGLSRGCAHGPVGASASRGELHLPGRAWCQRPKQINKLHLCRPLIRAIDSSNLKDDYSTAQRVTFRYYVGRKAMFDSDFKQAEEYLSFAFEHCHRASQKNKRMILIYLLPVKMLLGHMPTIELLRKYRLMQFAEVTKAVSEGNLLLLNEALTKHETFFIRCGIFLILEKLKIITYRNLFKKVYLLLRTHQLSLDAFLVALKFMQVEDVDIDEVQCILANLIYMGHIKGYISHQHQKLVVSKQNPFPPLSTVC
ncbi:PCI domain-containing protein 2 isoform X2 [Enhydra lutris kenyoni]|uniref:PCI domain-containing protein 2 n=1 Tax=Enhydra lutris kenyoni TaxID=391180 RepID=A0A2Y9JBE9_ENHLU|nr:PCI domain-containing protein 2 isoform X2 [Enhydra lutris kenyoni]